MQKEFLDKLKDFGEKIPFFTVNSVGIRMGNMNNHRGGIQMFSLGFRDVDIPVVMMKGSLFCDLKDLYYTLDEAVEAFRNKHKSLNGGK